MVGDEDVPVVVAVAVVDMAAGAAVVARDDTVVAVDRSTVTSVNGYR